MEKEINMSMDKFLTDETLIETILKGSVNGTDNLSELKDKLNKCYKSPSAYLKKYRDGEAVNLEVKSVDEYIELVKKIKELPYSNLRGVYPQHYKIYKNSEGKYVYEKKEDISKDEANEKFSNEIKPLLDSIRKASDINDLIRIEQTDDNYANFPSKMFLRKYAFLCQLEKYRENENRKDIIDLVCITKTEAMDFLYRLIKNSDDKFELEGINSSDCEDTWFYKSNYIAKYCKAKYDIGNNDLFYQTSATESVLWDDYYNFHPMVSLENPNAILYGAPGTGKTYSVKKLLQKIPSEQVIWTQFHPNYSYEDFIEGFRPTGVDESGKLKFSVVNGSFKELCIRALKSPDKPYFFVADEINRGNLSSIFGETLSLLETDYRYNPNNKDANLVSTPLSSVIEKIGVDSLIFTRDSSGSVKFSIPRNVFFIGMMNDVDKSIDSFDLALRRRFSWKKYEFDENALLVYLFEKYDGKTDYENLNSEITRFINNVNNLNKYISEGLNLGDSYKFGHSFFMKITTIKRPEDICNRRKVLFHKKDIETLFNKYLATTLTEYLRSLYSDKEIETNVEKAREALCADFKE